jgi:hypothetical protein
MIDEVFLTPRADGSGLDATHIGALAALLSACAEISGDKNPSAGKSAEGQLSVVAGARCNLNRTIVLYRPTPNCELRLI